MESLTGKAIAEMRVLGQQSADLLLEGKITVAQFERDIAYATKQLGIWQYGLGSGGVGQLDYRDYGIIGSHQRFQLQKLRGFTQDILDGKLSPAQIRARLDLYFEKTHGMYERGRLEAHRRAGFLWERRILGSVVPCGDCPRFANAGWVTIGTLPNPTESCACRANCKCRKEFSDSITKPA